MGDNGSWIMRKRSNAQVVRPTDIHQCNHNKRQQFSCHFFIVVNATYSGLQKLAFLGQSWVSYKLGDDAFPNSIQLEFTQQAAPLRPSTVFAPDHPPLVPKWFMFCGLCFCASGQSFPRPLPWKSLTTVSPRLCCVLAALLASSLPPVVLLLLLRPPILRSPALA